jgi:hypothetical protein
MPKKTYAKKTGKKLIIASVKGIIDDSSTLAMTCSFSLYSRYLSNENQAKKQPKPTIKIKYSYQQNTLLNEINFESEKNLMLEVVLIQSSAKNSPLF